MPATSTSSSPACPCLLYTSSTHILQSVKSSDFSEVVYEYEPQLLDSVDIDEKNLEAVKYGMYLMANEGSVKNAFAEMCIRDSLRT